MKNGEAVGEVAALGVTRSKIFLAFMLSITRKIKTILRRNLPSFGPLPGRLSLAGLWRGCGVTPHLEAVPGFYTHQLNLRTMFPLIHSTRKAVNASSQNGLYRVTKGVSIHDATGLSSLSSGQRLSCSITVCIHAMVIQLLRQEPHCTTWSSPQFLYGVNKLQLFIKEGAGTCRNRRGSCGRSSWRSLCSRHSWTPRSVCRSPGPRRWSRGSRCHWRARWCLLIRLGWSLRAENRAR